MLGYLDPVGLAGGALRLDAVSARAAVAEKLAAPLGLSVEEAAHGMLRVVSATMMRAIRAVTVERGRDARTFPIVAFGGNGPLFAAGIAAELGVRTVIVPPMPGLFSAFGLLLADTEHHTTRSLRLTVFGADPSVLQKVLDTLVAEGHARLSADGFTTAAREMRLGAMARYVGQSSEIAVDLPMADAAAVLAALPSAFAAEHERTYGFRAPSEEPVELTALSLVARGIPGLPRLPRSIPPRAAGAPWQRPAWFPTLGWVDTVVLDRADLAGSIRQGPLIIQEYDATCLVPPGMDATLDGFGAIVLTWAARASSRQ